MPSYLNCQRPSQRTGLRRPRSDNQGGAMSESEQTLAVVRRVFAAFSRMTSTPSGICSTRTSSCMSAAGRQRSPARTRSWRPCRPRSRRSPTSGSPSPPRSRKGHSRLPRWSARVRTPARWCSRTERPCHRRAGRCGFRSAWCSPSATARSCAMAPYVDMLDSLRQLGVLPAG